ncbi:hypothetical protein EWM64_g4505 [Hericium alpestre]|uniref:Uncharacterized protein n=1 Tax=Hericium alpestre TaxID=135208 RepID=A0A4Y9ZXB2_9AGAM|nr:hypothetical protein EWM64_g4505 [Hericium alpestre]
MLQSTLQAQDAESKKLGQSHTTACFSLQLEDELAHAHKALDERETASSKCDGVIDRLHVENHEAVQTQVRLNVSEKFDTTQTGLSVAEAEIAVDKAPVHYLLVIFVFACYYFSLASASLSKGSKSHGEWGARHKGNTSNSASAGCWSRAKPVTNLTLLDFQSCAMLAVLADQEFVDAIEHLTISEEPKAVAVAA